jgi:hypothetical protein
MPLGRDAVLRHAQPRRTTTAGAPHVVAVTQLAPQESSADTVLLDLSPLDGTCALSGQDTTISYATRYFVLDQSQLDRFGGDLA